MAVFGVVLGLGASVEAQEKTVVLLNLEGRAWRANTRVLKAELSKAADYNLQDQDWFHDRARQRAVSVNDMLDFPDSIVAASDRDGPEGDRGDAIIGPVSATGGEITVEVYNASTGTPVGTVAFAARGGRLIRRKIGERLPDLQALINLTGWVGADMTFAPEPIGEPALEPVLDEELVEESEPEPREAGWIHAHAGMTLAKRDFSLASATEELQYSSSFYPGVSIGGDAYPLTLVTSEWWSDVGITAHFMRAFDDATIDEGSGPREVPVTHQDFGFGVIYPWALSEELSLRFGAGVDFVDFVLADNPFYSSTTYRAFWLGTRATYRWSEDLSLFGGLQLLPVVGLGESEEDFGEDSSTFGFALDATARYALFDGLYVEGGYRIQVFNSSFDGVGVRRLEQVETTDIYNSVSVWAGYQL